MDQSYPVLKQALILLPFVLPIAIWVSWADLKFMKIPNKAVLAMAAVWIALGWLCVPLNLYLWSFAIMAGALVLGFLGNMIGLFGAGDAKFAAAMAGVFVGGNIFLIALLYAGCSILALVLHRILKQVPAVRRATPDWESWRRERVFPMGTALTMMLVLYLLAAFMPQG
ncbi:prepilin peptidase [Rhodobacter sp.]